MSLKSRKVPRRGEEANLEPTGRSTTLADIADRAKGGKRLRSQIKKGRGGKGGGIMGLLRRLSTEMNKSTSKMPSEDEINKGLWR